MRCLVLLLLLVSAACHRTEVPHQAKKTHAHASVYVVRAGDTLYSIGKRFGVDYHALARRNHIRYPYRIYVGQHLSLAGTATYSRRLPGVATSKSAHHTNRHAPPGKHRALTTSTRLIWPLHGKVTSRFGKRGSRMHDGIDIAAREGTAVHAAASGEVVYADQRLSGYGRMVIIRHANNIFTAYAHNQRNLVSKGQHVKQGAVIARVGHSGRATGAHLHFEVRRGSTAVDPLAYLPAR